MGNVELKVVSEPKVLGSAEELFRELSPASGSMWRTNDHIDPLKAGWIFRGQSNDEDGSHWPLKPTAHRRPDAFVEFYGYGPTQLQGRELRLAELDVVERFIQTADLHGFVIPGEDYRLRDTRLISKKERNYAGSPHFPPYDLLGMFGLAQHHGVPTRLLDWTTKPLVAVYFAAVAISKRYYKSGIPPKAWYQYFSIYAVRRVVAEMSPVLDPEIHFLTVPTATNANLHAQGGLFSLVQFRDPADEDVPPAIDDVLKIHADKLLNSSIGHLAPLMIEFRVPIGEARTVLATLASLGITAATVSPNLQGVADSVKEERFRQYAPPHDRRT